MPDQLESSLHDAAFAIWAHTTDLDDVLAVEGVAVRNVSRPIHAHYLEGCRAALQNTIGFQGGGSLDKRAVDFELCINCTHLQYRHGIVGFIVIAWVRIWCDLGDLGALTHVELFDGMGRVWPVEGLEKVLN